MKRTFNIFLVLFLFIAAIQNFAQDHELIVPDDDFLNSTINGDTTSTGDRVDMNRVYILERGKQYYINSDIINEGYALRIVAQEGEGLRPVILMAQNEWTGNYPWVPFQLAGDIFLKGIVITGMPPDDDTYVTNSIIWCIAPGFDIVIDDCIFTDVSGQMIRTQSPQRKLQITNTILADIGFIGLTGFGTGKGLDFRDGSIDSVIIVNNTWVNIQSRLIRHRNGTAPINNLDFRHNTIINCMASDGVFELGVVGESIVIKNNLLFNPFTKGRDLTDVNRNEFDGHGEKEPDGVTPKMVMLGSVQDSSNAFNTIWDVQNNYYVHTQEQQDWWAANNLLAPYPMTDYIASKLSNPDNAFIEEAGLSLEESTNIPFELMDWYRDVNGANFVRSVTTTEYDMDRRHYTYYLDTLNAAYPTTSAAYTGSTYGEPVGDLRWFPGFVVDVKKEVGLPSEFALEQNYPNPFNPTTNIKFSIAESGFVTLRVFNVLGQVVATLVNQELTQGAYSFDFDASMLSSGTYLYTITSGNFIQAKKMLLMK
ncbi:MAG: T9SS type A sorting domain-containing protein [Melioribacteraceae bacterium]|nr:T9SS type A sorting domain-containing protein [Melioribacteraceae bacterium]